MTLAIVKFYGGLLRLYIGDVKVQIEYSFVLIISFFLLLGNYSMMYVLLFSALHELGHIALLYALGGKADKITVAYYGIGLKHQAKFTVGKEILFLLGGILVNGAFAIFNVHRQINLSLLLINAMPIYPLDGGRVIKLLLYSAFDLALSDKLFLAVGICSIIAIIIAAVIYGNLSLALIAFYLIIYSLNNSLN